MEGSGEYLLSELRRGLLELGALGLALRLGPLQLFTELLERLKSK